MWPRIVELTLGVWLLVSPTIVGGAEGAGGRVIPWIAGVAVLILSGSTFVARFRLNNLGNLPVAAFLIVWGWSQAPRPGPAWAQSLILTGLLLALTAIVPTGAARPPQGWRPYVNERD